MRYIICLWLLLVSTHSGAAVTVSQRVWIALESPFLVDDGYASGVVLSVDASFAEVEVRQLEERGERTLYGSCRGGLSDNTPLPAEAKHQAYIEQVPVDLIASWRDGQHRFLQRELLGVRYQRWADQAPGLNPVSLDDAIKVAKAVANQRVADAFEMMGILRRARAPLGFIAPVEQRAQSLEEATVLLTEQALLHPEELDAAIAQSQPTDLLGRTLVLTLDRLINDYQQLDPASQQSLRLKMQSQLRKWATGDDQWQAPADLQLRLPFLRG